MKRYWLALESVIAVAAGATVSYLFSILFDLPLALVLGLYLTATVTTLWMVFRILKDPYSTDKTFDEFFYQDRDDIRRNVGSPTSSAASGWSAELSSISCSLCEPKQLREASRLWQVVSRFVFRIEAWEDDPREICAIRAIRCPERQVRNPPWRLSSLVSGLIAPRSSR